jgi:hypothetical protein
VTRASTGRWDYWDRYIEGQLAKPQFRKLSDIEWTAIWKCVKAASGKRPLPNETQIRRRVNESAWLSGYFFAFAALPYRQTYLEFAKIIRKFLRLTDAYLLAATKFFEEPDDTAILLRGQADAYLLRAPKFLEKPNERVPPPRAEQKILSELQNLKACLEQKIVDYERLSREAPPPPPSAAKPERDQWMARLILVWSKDCGLSSNNSKHLRAFLINALRPYQLLTDRKAEQFINRWNRGEIPHPPSDWKRYIVRQMLAN